MKIKIFFATLFMSLLIPFASAFADEVTPITSLQNLIDYKDTPGNYRLDANISLSGNLTITANDFILDLNGNTISVGGNTLLANGNITIKDTSANQDGKITGSSASPRAIQVGNNSTFTLESGTLEGVDTFALWPLSGATAILNGGTVTSDTYTIINSGTVIVNGATVNSTGSEDVAYYGQNNSNLILNSGTIKTEGDYAYAVLLSKPGSQMTMNGGEVLALNHRTETKASAGIVAFKDTTIVINGGTVHTYDIAICGNGSVSGKNEGSNMKLTITGGTIISDAATAIYIPQPNGETNISGGTITGTSAVEVRAGKLNITGGTFNGGSDSYEVVEEHSGTATKNVAVAVIQHDTKLPLEVNITGGTFNANMPFIEANPLRNPEEAIEKISITIGDDESENRPIFNSAGESTVLSEDKSGFVYAGLYTHNVTDYVAENHGEIDENSMEAVYPYHEVKNDIPADFPAGTVDVDVERTLRGSLVTVNVNPAPGYYVDEIIVTDAKGNRVPLINKNQFYAPNSDVSIHVVFAVVNPATTDDNIDYFAFMGICIAAFICSVSSLLLGKKMATIASRRGE